MAQLAASINASTRRLTLDDDLVLERGATLRLGDEVMRFTGYGLTHRGLPDASKLVVERGDDAAGHAAGTEIVTGLTVGIEATYEGTSSFQPIAADLELGADAGNVATNPKFLAAVMGNLLGADLAKAGAYLAGVIAALSITGTRATDYQIGALLGVVMDGVTDADGVVVAVIDGDDPSSATRANAAFAARMNNNNVGSGVDYGVDLYDAGNPNYTGGGKPLAIAKALLRSPSQVCILEGDASPGDGGSGTGAGFAEAGSIYIRTHSGSVAAYLNTGSAASPAWKAITHA